MRKKVRKDIFTNYIKFFWIYVQFIHLDPDPATQINAGPDHPKRDSLFICSRSRAETAGHGVHEAAARQGEHHPSHRQGGHSHRGGDCLLQSPGTARQQRKQSFHGPMNYKDTKPYMSAFLSVDLLTDFAAFCLTDFIDWRYIHSWLVCNFDPACELLPPWKKEFYFTCVLLPLYCTFSLTSFPLPPFPTYSIQTVCDCGGGGGGLKCTVDHILQEFYTLFLTRFRTYKIASPPLT